MTSNGVKLEGEDIFSYTRSRKKGCCKVQTSLQEPFKSVALKIALVAKLCQTLCHSMDCNPSGSSVYGILQARILEWVTISFSRGSSQPRDWTCVLCIAGKCFTSLLSEPARKPQLKIAQKSNPKLLDFLGVLIEVSIRLSVPIWLHNLFLPCKQNVTQLKNLVILGVGEHGGWSWRFLYIYPVSMKRW